MPTLDDCINNVHEVGHVVGSAGLPPTRVVLGSLEDPDDYDPETVTYSLDGTKFYNSGYFFVTLVW